MILGLLICGCKVDSDNPPSSDQPPKGFIVDSEEFHESFKGVGSRYVKDYPGEIEQVIINRLKNEYTDSIESIEIVVFHPATIRTTTANGNTQTQEPFVDTTTYIARIDVKLQDNYDLDTWTFSFDKRAKLQWKMKN